MLIGGIEAGGTKFVCAVSRGDQNILEEVRFHTGVPGETMGRAITFFKQMEEKYGKLDAIGIGCFGPIDLNHDSPSYGRITMTPKLAWRNADVVGPMVAAFGGADFKDRIAFDTDVNGAALAEKKWGAGRKVASVLYLTVGTGIGGGAALESGLVHGLLHPEMGHIPVPHDLKRDPFPGICPSHRDCLEGLASGPAIQARWGKPAQELPPDHPAWDLEADYIANALATYIYVLSPECIVLGGGVMEQQQLFPLIRKKVRTILNGYIASPIIDTNIDAYIVPPALGNKAGVLGAIALGMEAVKG